ARSYSSNHDNESFEAFTERYVKFFEGVDDQFELKRGLNNCFAYDLVPAPSVIEASLRAARRVNDFSTAVRIFEGIKQKVENSSQYNQYLEELKPIKDELGILTKEEMDGFVSKTLVQTLGSDPSVKSSKTLGINVIVTVKGGIKYQGLLSRACTESELGVVLKCARKVLSKQDEKTIPNGMINEFIIFARDLMEIYATGVDFSSSEKTSTEREDADISGRTEIRERELHKWTPDESGETLKESANASWDQFAANEQLFGLTTDYNEEIYTTKLDRSKADYKERERKAINLANEITRERGYIVDDQIDEEERDPSKYMPPHLRKQQEQQIQQNGVTPAVKKTETNNEVTKDAKVKPPEDIKPTTKSAQPATNPTSPSSSIPKIPPFTPSPSSLSSYRIPEHVMASLQIPRFATSEKERLQQRKQAIFKKEMDGKMAELLKWGQNFKLNSPLPEDLIPILTKDETKQPKVEFVKPSIKIEEVQPPKSNGESKTTSSEKVVSEKPTSAADKAPPQFPPTRTPATTQTNTKLNAKAPEWKPNPNAASFTPEDIYSQAAANQSFGFAAYPVAAPYRYPSGTTQFVGVPPMPLQQATPMPYLQPSSPGRTPIVPTGIHPQIYQPYQNQHGK
ncbi:15468_t:CDS:10, partial [Racocetra fulgida]